MTELHAVLHGADKIDLFDTREEALDFGHALPDGSWTIFGSNSVTDHTAAGEEVEWENYNARSKALELALRTGAQGGDLIRTAVLIQGYLERGTIPDRPVPPMDEVPIFKGV